MTDYAFSSMRVRMLEKTLLSPSIFHRILEAEGLAEALSILKETAYADFFRQVEEEGDFDQALALAEEKRMEDLRQLAADPILERFLFLAESYHNLKVEIKATTQPDRYEKLLLDAGKKTRPIPGEEETAWLNAIKSQALALWQEKEDAQALDLFLDRAYFEEMARLAQELQGDFFPAYVSKLADLTNLLSFFRARQQKQSRHFFSEVFLPGGKLAFSDMASFWTAFREERILDSPSLGKWMQTLRRASQGDFLTEAMEAFAKEEQMTEIEQRRDNYNYEASLEAGRVQVGPEVLFSYKLRFQNELRNLRMLLSAKRAGLNQAAMKERLSPQGLAD